MRKRVILHGGLPKCGSTLLQVILRRHQKPLVRHGFFLPRAEDDRNASHMSLALDLSEDHRGPAPRLAGYVAAFEASGAQAMILSSETFAMRAAQMRADAIGGLMDAYDVSVVLYWRRHDRWLSSCYKQMVRMSHQRCARSFEDFLEDDPQGSRLYRFSLTGAADDLCSLFGAGEATLVDLDGEESDTIASFAAMTGLPLAEWRAHVEAVGHRKGVPGRTSNASFSDVETLFLAEANRRGYPKAVHEALVWGLRAADPDPDLAAITFMSEERSADCLRRFDAANAARARHYGLEPKRHAPLVPRGPVRQAVTAAEWDAIYDRVAPHLEPDIRAAVTDHRVAA